MGRRSEGMKKARPKACRGIPGGAGRSFPRFLFGGGNDLLVEKVIDHHGRGVEGAAHGVVVADVGKPFLFAEPAHPGVQLRPVGAVFPAVDGVVQGRQLRVPVRDVAQDGLLVAAAEVQIFQPDEVALIPGPADDGRHVGDAGENGRNEAGGAHARLVEGFHGRQTALDADGAVHVVLEGFIEGIDGPGDAGPGKGSDEVQIAQYQIGFGGDADGAAAALHLFQQRPRAAGGLLQRLVGVADGADEQLFPGIAFRISDIRPVLHVHEGAPRLGMAGEALHEGRVAVFTAVLAAHVGIDRVIRHRQIGPGEHAFHGHVADLYIHVISSLCHRSFLDASSSNYYTES